jgi:hypothetical protein
MFKVQDAPREKLVDVVVPFVQKIVDVRDV